MNDLFLGIDLGTSGVRAVALDAAGGLIAQARAPLPEPLREPQPDGERRHQDPALWWQAVQAVLDELLARLDRSAVRALAVDGTSGTLLLTDAAGRPLAPASMYNDRAPAAWVARVAELAPADSAAHGSSSPAARLLEALAAHPQAAHALHQADWIAAQFSGRLGLSDDNNALKLGWEPRERVWPQWLAQAGVPSALLPQVLAPGEAIGPVTAAIAARFGLSKDCLVVAGSTDGVAAFLATGADQVGDAVTSLGSTLVVKLLADRPVNAPEFGLYSHRLGTGGGVRWLVGGASNSGGAALLQHFSAQRMAELTPALRPDAPTGLNYYPLPAPGERFPINDPALPPRVTPRPAEDARFFQGLLEGVAGVEQLAYQRMAALGAPAPRRVFTVGGGARNVAWTHLRAQALGVPMATPAHEEAACGSARLARQGWTASQANRQECG